MYYLADIPEIKIASDVLFNVGPFPITDSMMGMMLVNVLLIVFALWVRKGAGVVPSRIQVMLEEAMSFFLNLMKAAFNGDEKRVKRFFPLIFTMFLAFFIANQFAILPIINEITTSGGEMSLFRVPTSDFSLPIAMALVVVVLANIMALSIAPIKHIGNFIKIEPFLRVRSVGDFLNACLEFFLAILDIIGEIAKVVSLSARLFGNVIAGELMVLIITYLAAFTNFIVPMPFVFLSIFSGVIHAFVFPLLSIQYLAGTISSVESPAELEPQTQGA